MKLKVLDLFSGIGGFSLGLQRAGFETVAFCEIDPYCRRVLQKHWPDVKQYEDVTKLTAKQLKSDGIFPDVICGGFPCQDISVAGKGAGIKGERSGLWKEYARIISELRPKYIIVENVSALLSRGLGDVLGDLATLGYDAEWHCIPASAVGAPHRRDRVWIIGFNANSSNVSKKQEIQTGKQITNTSRISEILAYSDGTQRQRRCLSSRIFKKYTDIICPGGWKIEPNVGRVAHGVPKRMDRLKALGNAVVPQIPELIGLAILERETA